MGIKHFWNVIQDFSVQIDIHALQNKRIAIDITYWIIRFIYSHKEQEVTKQEVCQMVLSFYQRCISNGIKPIFVFDGKTNTFLKQKTIEKRRKNRNETLSKLERLMKMTNEEYDERIQSLNKIQQELLDQLKISADLMNKLNDDWIENVEKDEEYEKLRRELREIRRRQDDMEKEYESDIVSGRIMKQGMIIGDFSRQQIDQRSQLGMMEIRKQEIEKEKERRIGDISDNIEDWGIGSLNEEDSSSMMEKYLSHLNDNEMNEKKNENSLLQMEETSHNMEILNQLFSKSENESETKDSSKMEDQNESNEISQLVLQEENDNNDDEFDFDKEMKELEQSLSEIENKDCGNNDEMNDLLNFDEELKKLEEMEKSLSEINDNNTEKDNEMEEVVLLKNENEKNDYENDISDIKEDPNKTEIIPLPLDLFDTPTKTRSLSQLSFKRMNSLEKEEENSYEMKLILDEDIKEEQPQIKIDEESEDYQSFFEEEQEERKMEEEKDKEEINLLEILLRKEEEAEIPNEKHEMMYDFSNGRLEGEMKEAIIEMLQRVHIPFIVSPGEAEAQCYQLEKENKCDYIATNDSDIFAYGGMNIIKNLFVKGERLELYEKKSLMMNTDQIIIFSLLTGNDYTEGINGVGKIRAKKAVCLFETLNHFESFLQLTHNSKNIKTVIDNYLNQMKIIEYERKQLTQTLKKIVNQMQTLNNTTTLIIQQFKNPNVTINCDEFEWIENKRIIEEYKQYYFD